MNSNNSKTVLKLLFFAFALGAYLCGYLIETSVFHHLALGKWILAHSELPRTYYWSDSGSTTLWFDQHWLLSIFTSLFFQNFSFLGLTVAKLSLCILTTILLLYLYFIKSKKSFFAGVATYLVASAMLSTVEYGGILFAVFLFAGNFLIVEKYIENKNKLLLILFFLLNLIYSNVDTSYLFAIPVLLIFLSAKLEKRELIQLLMAFVFPVILKPSPMDNLKFYLSKFNSSLQYQLATRADVASIFDFSVCFLTILFILILIFLIQSKLFAKYQQQISIFGLMIVVGLVSKIYLAFPLMLGGYILSSLYAEIEGSDSKLYYGIERLGAILGKLSVTAVIWVYFCIAYVCIARVLSFPELESVYPKAETDYLINNNLTFPLFADSKISEYLMYKFIDERGEPTRRLSFDAQSVSNKEDYLVAEFRNNQGYIFDKLNPKSALVLAYSTTYYLLKNNANWQLIWVNGKELIKSGETEKPKPYSWLIFKKINDSDEKQQTTN